MEFTINKNKHVFVYLIFLAIFILGITIYNDYGLNIDDEWYKENGEFYYQYIKLFFSGQNSTSLNDIKSLSTKIIGFSVPYMNPVLFELPQVYISRLLNFNVSKEIYEFGHLLNFLIFFTSLVFFYKIISNKFKSTFYGIIAIVILITTPRIFAESFYNSRDIFFLSLFIFFLYACHKFLIKRTFKTVFYISLTSAFLIYAKVVGFIPVFLFFIFYYLSFTKEKKFKKSDLYYLFFIFVTIIFFVYILWPYLWIDPINNFILAFKRMVSDHNSLYLLNFYFGDLIPSTNTPWHYRIVWFLITTPIYILVFFTIGFSLLIYQIITRFINLGDTDDNLWKNHYEMFNFYLFTVFILIFFSTIKFNPSQFGSWRHLYFLYPIVIIFFLIGIDFIKSIFKSKILRLIILLTIFFNIIYLSYWNYKYHPNQYVFFNYLTKNYAMNNFDLDYWGLSNVQSIRYILENNKNDNIKVGTISFTPLRVSKLLLTEDQKKRLIIVGNLEEADYLVDSYMKRLRSNFVIDKSMYSKYFEIIINDVPINTVYKKN